jgi:hypothetical protein
MIPKSNTQSSHGVCYTTLFSIQNRSIFANPTELSPPSRSGRVSLALPDPVIRPSPSCMTELPICAHIRPREQLETTLLPTPQSTHPQLKRSIAIPLLPAIPPTVSVVTWRVKIFHTVWSRPMRSQIPLKDALKQPVRRPRVYKSEQERRHAWAYRTNNAGRF